MSDPKPAEPPVAHLIVNGRHVALIVGEDIDEFGQFRVAIEVDGKERWSGWFTDRSDERVRQAIG